jgi:hypothetical protein
VLISFHCSQYQARRTFAQYLICILRQVSGQNKADPIIEDHSELILRFLQKASSNLRTPYFVQVKWVIMWNFYLFIYLVLRLECVMLVLLVNVWALCFEGQE